MPPPRSAAIALPLTSRDVIEREVAAIVISVVGAYNRRMSEERDGTS
jgi:hypothetical protein